MTDPRATRSLAFGALALFGALHWGPLVSPGATGPLALAVLLALLSDRGTVPLSGFAAAIAGRRGWRSEKGTGPLSGIVAAVAGAVIALVLAGVPLRLLVPDEWGALASGIGSGLEALPGTRVPYGGPDEWVRSVIVLGGVLLVGAGGVLALRGRTVAAAVVLGVLYVVPVVERDPALPYLDGALFAVLLAALIWADRLRREDLAMAGALLGVATLAGLAVAPRVDAQRPWLDYEQLARDLDAQRTSTFSWDHSYRALDWTREGREVLRVGSRLPSYWKAAALEEFDGVRWRRARGVDPSEQDTEVQRESWVRDVRFEVRALRSTQVVAAGTTLRVRGARPRIWEATPGTFETLRTPLRRGDEYVARTYVPRPTAQRMREAGTDYPAFVRRQLSVGLPAAPGEDPMTVGVAPWGADEPTYAFPRRGLPSTQGVEELRASPYRRMFELARRQRAASATPYDFARRLSAYLQRDATYTETPPTARLPLDAFVFGRRAGYCQQFSGAMALLLRLGGVPARVASGFSPGAYDEPSGTWTVRDLDAHSWVEVYFPRIGWVAFDPTPAAAPAGGRDDEAELAPAAAGDVLGDDPLGREEAAGGGGDEAAESDGGAARWPLLLGAAVLLLAGSAAVVVRRRARADRGGDGLPREVDELLKALRGTGREPGAGLTLQAIERSLGGGPAADYVRALRLRRFGAAAEPASPEGRAALRRELADGLDLRARLRAWATLAPDRAELRTRLRHGVRRPG